MTWLTDARAEWDRGHIRVAAAILTDRIPNRRKPIWAADILDIVGDYFDLPAPGTELRQVARVPARWSEGAILFERARKKTLAFEKDADRSNLAVATMLAIENAAKVIALASGRYSYDPDSAEWLVACALDVAELVGNVGLKDRVWELTTAAASP